MVSYERGQNYYQKIRLIELMGVFVLAERHEEVGTLLLQMLRVVPILLITEGLVVRLLLRLRVGELPLSSQFYNIVSHKCLEFKRHASV